PMQRGSSRSSAGRSIPWARRRGRAVGHASPPKRKRARGPANPNRSSLSGTVASRSCCFLSFLLLAFSFFCSSFLFLFSLPAACHEHQRAERQCRPHAARRAQATLAGRSRRGVAAVSPLAGCPGNPPAERQDAVAAFATFELAPDHAGKLDDKPVVHHFVLPRRLDTGRQRMSATRPGRCEEGALRHPGRLDPAEELAGGIESAPRGLPGGHGR